MGYILGTGFEHNDRNYMTGGWGDWAAISYETAKTGSYSIKSTEYYGFHPITVPFNDNATASEIWFSFYVNIQSLSTVSPIGFYLTDGTVIGLVRNSSYNWAIYKNGTTISSSSISVVYNTWINIMGHIKVSSGSDGVFEFNVEGGSYHTYNGANQPSSSNLISRFYFSPNDGYADDVAVSDSGPTGDIRFKLIKPNSDESVTWDRSTGSTNYTLVDEVGPNDGDYVSSGSDNYKDFYGLESFSSSIYIYPVFATQYIRAKKEYADDTKMKMLVKLDSTEDASSEIDLTTSFQTYRRTLNKAPDTTDWTNEKFEDLQIGVESIIP